jgi:hypothetical protein
MDALPRAIEAPAEEVQEAIWATMEQIEEAQRAQAEAEERAYRASSRLHVILVTERTLPQPIFVGALLGVERLLRRDLDLERGEDTYIEQALALLPDSVAAFGKVVGFVLNYTPDHAIEFGRAGIAVATLQRAVRPGEADLTLRNGRSIIGIFRAAPQRLADQAIDLDQGLLVRFRSIGRIRLDNLAKSAECHIVFPA